VSASPTETVERDLIRELRSRTRTSQVLPTASRSFCTTTARRWARASRSAGPSRLTLRRRQRLDQRNPVLAHLPGRRL